MNSILDMYEQQYSSSRENDIVGSLEAIEKATVEEIEKASAIVLERLN